jgi:MFS family permease
MVIEFPAGMLLRYTHPRYVFSGALVSFGIFAACMAHAKSYAATMILRVFIGLGEAVANNAYIFISLWYKPNELSLRTGAIYSLTPIAGAVSGIISYGAGKNLSGVSGLFSWQWLFVIEGVVTIFCGLLLFVLCPGLPETVSVQGNWLFRTQSEHQAILRRYKACESPIIYPLHVLISCIFILPNNLSTQLKTQCTPSSLRARSKLHF